MLPAEMNYETHDQELLAIVEVFRVLAALPAGDARHCHCAHRPQQSEIFHVHESAESTTGQVGPKRWRSLISRSDIELESPIQQMGHQEGPITSRQMTSAQQSQCRRCGASYKQFRLSLQRPMQLTWLRGEEPRSHHGGTP
jgi:hypothetical protein